MIAPGPDLERRFLGCLVGCAVGDALGAPFEGYWSDQLPGRGLLLGGFAELAPPSHSKCVSARKATA